MPRNHFTILYENNKDELYKESREITMKEFNKKYKITWSTYRKYFPRRQRTRLQYETKKQRAYDLNERYRLEWERYAIEKIKEITQKFNVSDEYVEKLLHSYTITEILNWKKIWNEIEIKDLIYVTKRDVSYIETMYT